MNEVLRDADIVSLHTPPRADGAPLFVPREMRRGAVLINTARAGLVSEEALLEALESGYLAGAGVDVFEPEPPVDRRLLEHPRVIALPHVGGYTPESIQRAMDQAVGNLLEALT
jgi:phosphoglycerate dehydrogenase-like enzyme